MKTVAEYLERAHEFERMATHEIDPKLKAELNDRRRLIMSSPDYRSPKASPTDLRRDAPAPARTRLPNEETAQRRGKR
ncbi:hypothetical protein BraRD5C2_39390 [Bradyrhizobium sp. RD5-C2]|nr:hypothetical protein BraRD5C2_39390 [Bradyrhizobium sp. RD5-C2]